MSKQTVIILFFLLSISPLPWLTAQNPVAGDVSYHENSLRTTKGKSYKSYNLNLLLSNLESQLKKGSRRALRDVGTLLDKSEYRESAILLLAIHTFFTEKEIDVAHSTREQFLTFFYNNQDRIKFSEVLQAFYITPVEFQSYNFVVQSQKNNIDEDPSVQLRRWVLEFDRAYRTGSDAQLLQNIIEKIANLDCKESYQWLRNTLQSAPFNKNQIGLYLTIAESLKNEAIEENLNAILDANEKGYLPTEFLSPILLELTNYSTTVEQTRQLLDSLESFDALRAYGYEQSLPFKEAYYYEKADYYGKILSRKDTPWIQRNALRDLIKSDTPRALFYIAAQVRLKPEQRDFYIKTLKKLTKSQFSLTRINSINNQSFESQLEEIEILKNFVCYWANHADDYEWDKERQIFVNKNEIAERTELYEKLFRRLNSENDSVAFAAFLQLTQGEPTTISEMADKYRPLLRTYNKRLPDIRYGYLEQLTQLNYYCLRNKISLDMPKTVDSLINLLFDTRSPQLRFAIENKIIKLLTVEHLTALEIKGCLYSGNQDFAFSISRILDYVYSRDWSSVIEKDEQLRLFLKKSFLFKKIGVVGICSGYSNKFEKISDYVISRLKDIARIEDDPDITSQIQILLSSAPTSNKESNSLLDVFFENPLSFEGGDLKILPNPQISDFQRVLGKMQSESNRKILSLMLNFLDNFATIDAVPMLFQLTNDERRLAEGEDTEGGETVSQHVISLLENIYGHSVKEQNKRQAWRMLWQKDGANYKEWDKRFFNDQLKYIKLMDKLTIEDILEVSNSKYITEKQKLLVLQAVAKLQPFSDIRRFKSKLVFKASEDLKDFENMKIAAKDLDDFIKIFEVDKDTAMWAFINQKSNEYTLDELGTFYNSLFKVNWFVNQVQMDKISNYQKELAITILNEYVTNSEFLSEFEEQITLLNVAELQNVGHTVVEKLENSMKLEIPEEAKATIQEAILARVSYADISKIAHLLPELSRKPGTQPISFLYKDFGIPFFANDPKNIEFLVQNHKSLSPFEFYKYYLTKFGVDFLKDNDELDFNKIYDLLKYEIIAPFTGGGNQRDYFTYGLIKLLELKFNTRLGFHEKLNENQTFYTFSASKRAAKWMEYLVTNHFVVPNPKAPASFNRIYVEN